MKTAALPSAFLLGLCLSACANPLPPERAAYVGEWQRPEMYLLITQDGGVKYKRVKGSGNVSVEGPLKEFKGDDFSVGIGPMTTSFDVTQAPHKAPDGSWKMTVDGLELTRTSP